MCWEGTTCGGGSSARRSPSSPGWKPSPPAAAPTKTTSPTAASTGAWRWTPLAAATRRSTGTTGPSRRGRPARSATRRGTISGLRISGSGAPPEEVDQRSGHQRDGAGDQVLLLRARREHHAEQGGGDRNERPAGEADHR